MSSSVPMADLQDIRKADPVAFVRRTPLVAETTSDQQHKSPRNKLLKPQPALSHHPATPPFARADTPNTQLPSAHPYLELPSFDAGKTLKRRRSATLSGLLSGLSFGNTPSSSSATSSSSSIRRNTSDHSDLALQLNHTRSVSPQPVSTPTTSSFLASKKSPPSSPQPRKATERNRPSVNFSLLMGTPQSPSSSAKSADAGSRMQQALSAEGAGQPAPGVKISRFLSESLSKATSTAPPSSGARGSSLAHAEMHGTPPKPRKSMPASVSGGLPKDESWSSSLSSGTNTSASSIFDSAQYARVKNMTGSALPRVSISEESLAVGSGSASGSIYKTQSAEGYPTLRRVGELGTLDERGGSADSFGPAHPTSASSKGKSVESLPSSAKAKAQRRKYTPGGGDGWSWFLRDTVHSQRVHPYDAKSVPYTMPYSRHQTDRDILLTLATRDRLDIVPWAKRNELKLSPKRVLDIGCGISAFWITEAAKSWPEATFVGLDVAPVLLPLDKLDSALSSRISFVQANFLERLPFENASFDFIRIANIGAGVPESAWMHIYDEAMRVLRPDGVMQAVEGCILCFPEAGGDVAKVKSEKLYSYVEGQSHSHRPEGLSAQEPASTRVSVDGSRGQYTKMAGEIVRAAFEERLVSPFPVSMFPAYFVLSGKNVASEGPLVLTSSTERPSRKSWTSKEAQGEIELRVLEHVSAPDPEAFETYSMDAKRLTGAGDMSMRDFVDFVNGVKADRGDIQQRAGVSALLKDIFGWRCVADEKMERALQKQADSLALEKDAVRRSLAGSDSPPARLTEIDRALRECKSELDATRRRLGTNSFVDALPNRLFRYEVSMKAGTKLAA